MGPETTSEVELGQVVCGFTSLKSMLHGVSLQLVLMLLAWFYFFDKYIFNTRPNAAVKNLFIYLKLQFATFSNIF